MEYKKTETILKVDNVSLTLGDNQILKNVNFEIKDIVRPNMTQGQIIGLLGPSGIGKTKLFEAIAGILNKDNCPTLSGNILINKSLEPVKLGKVGVVQQSYPLFKHRTVGGNLELAARLKLKNKNDRSEAVKSILDRFGLYDKIDHYPSQLSGGQRQRVAIAQQLLCNTHFLLMDEPFSGLDVIAIKKICKMISDVANIDELNTIIIVSHDMASTAAISDTLLMLGRDRDENGKIIPGARVKYEYDLIEYGVAWQENIESTPLFHGLMNDLREKFYTL